MMVPSPVLLSDVLRNHCFNRAIGAFDGITLRRVNRSSSVCDSVIGKHFAEGCRPKLLSVIGDNSLRASVTIDDVVAECSGHSIARCLP